MNVYCQSTDQSEFFCQCALCLGVDVPIDANLTSYNPRLQVFCRLLDGVYAVHMHYVCVALMYLYSSTMVD